MKMKREEIFCEECGSPYITFYEDGTCVCEDCGFVFYLPTK